MVRTLDGGTSIEMSLPAQDNTTENKSGHNSTAPAAKVDRCASDLLQQG